MAALLLVLAVAACTTGRSADPTPSAPGTGPTLGSLAAFQEFAGLTVPATATDVDLQVVTGPNGDPGYKVRFRLPSAEVDAFCVAGELDRPLRVSTVPDRYRRTFDYQGDTASGVVLAQAGIPDNLDVQREVLAVGTLQPTAQVYVYAYSVAD
jgi:hypothetical protein